MSVTLQEIARIIDLQGELLPGKGDTVIAGICPLDEPQKDCLGFTTTNKAKRIKEPDALSTLTALLVPENFKGGQNLNIQLLPVPNPMGAIVKLIPLFYPERSKPEGISDKASIHPDAQIGKDVLVGPFCVIAKGVKIGDGSVLYPNVTLYEGVTIGKNTIIHAGAIVREFCQIGKDSVIQNGAIIGADGFGYLPDPEVGLRTVPQVGNVVLSDRVDVGANSCIDRATLGTTFIGHGTKLDNLVQVGHNVKVGSHTAICAHCGIAGSVTIGDRVTLGGQTGVADHVAIGNDIRVGGHSGVTETIKEKGDYIGMPIRKASQWRRISALLSRLPEIASFVSTLKKKNS